MTAFIFPGQGSQYVGMGAGLATTFEEARSVWDVAADMEAFERANLVRALEECGGKIAGENGVAQRLGLPPSTVSSRACPRCL